jgi:hypothetical protein
VGRKIVPPKAKKASARYGRSLAVQLKFAELKLSFCSVPVDVVQYGEIGGLSTNPRCAVPARIALCRDLGSKMIAAVAAAFWPFSEPIGLF